MPLTSEQARKATESFIEVCNVKSYVYDLREVSEGKFDDSDGTVGGLDPSEIKTFCFRAIWSRPTAVEPIPRAVAYCTYYVSGSSDSPRISYRVENETHVHRPEENLTFSEAWLDRVIDRKLKLSKWIDMTTPFDKKRIKELAELPSSKDEGKMQENTHAQAAENLDSQLDREELLDAERQLIQWFKSADIDGKGYLNAQEFYMLIRQRAGDLGLTDDEISLMLAYADENEDGVIEYKEFVPMAAELMQNLEARRLAAQVMQDRDLNAEAAANEELYSLEMEYTVETIISRLKECDSEGSGLVTRSDFHRAISHRKVGLMRHEINLVMSNCEHVSNTEVEGKSASVPMVKYGNIAQLLLAVRYHTTRQAVLAQNETSLESSLLKSCSDLDPSESGYIPLSDMKNVLTNIRGVMINRLQLYSLLAEAEIQWDEDSECDVIEYRSFVPGASVALQIMFDPVAVSERRKLIERAEVQPVDLLDGRDRSAIESELAALFKNFDANGNGFLDRGEFRRCLQSTELNLTKEEVAILMHAADADQNNNVDYNEFIEFAYNILLHLARERALKKLS